MNTKVLLLAALALSVMPARADWSFQVKGNAAVAITVPASQSAYCGLAVRQDYPVSTTPVSYTVWVGATLSGGGTVLSAGQPYLFPCVGTTTYAGGTTVGWIQAKQSGTFLFRVAGTQPPPGGGANPQLSNLAAPTAIPVDLIPSAAGKNLGSAALPWLNLYLAGAINFPAGNLVSLSGVPLSCPVALTGQGEFCLDVAANRFVYSYSGGPKVNVLLATDNLNVDLGTLTYNAGGTTTFAAAGATNAGGVVTATHGTASTFSPTGLVKWGNYVVEIKQDSTGGGVTFTLGAGGSCSAWKVGGSGGGAIVLSITPLALDVLAFTFDGANCVANFRTTFN